jgi:glycosyltransferase involved in cell wall biosynthesis
VAKVDIVRSLGRVLDVTRSGDASRRAGDRARDARRWNEAAAHYADFLERNPGNVDIRVQLGNCLKEDGRLADALIAYDLAIKLNETHADAYLQRGHLLKIMGRIADAINDYRKSFALCPQDNPAFQELLNLRALEETDAAAPKGHENTDDEPAPAICVDITDLIDYLRVNTSLSGIQRVLSNLLASAPTFMAGSSSASIRPVLPDYNGSKVFLVNMGLVQGLISLVVSGRQDRETLDRALESIVRSRSPVELKAGDTILIAGAFWIYQRYDLLNMLRQKNVSVTVFIHDLIQVTNPEFVEPAATTVFRRSLVDVLSVCSYVMTNSNFVAEEVRRYLKDRLNFQIPVIPITLATELNARSQDLSMVNNEYINMAQEPYVLFVGTIEIRKNHMYIIEVWEKLIKHFEGNVPNLVFVGKWGWEISTLQKYLEKSDYLGGRLYIYNAISDNDLEYIYRNCQFTVYPSFAEGWGLPVGESLWYGKPCVASKTTAIPEVGGSLCKYIDPFNVEDGFRVISKILTDPQGLKAWAAQIRQQFRPKSWSSFSCEVFETIQNYERNNAGNVNKNNCVIENGEIATFGNDPLAQLDARQKRLVTARMTRLAGWHGVEAWGCWAARRKATLRFGTRMAPGTDVLVYLHLKAPDGDESAECTIKINQTPTFVDDLGPVPVWCVAPGRVGEHGIIEVLLVSGRGFFHRHGRELYVGILGIAVAEAGDREAQSRLLEQIVRRCIPCRHASSESTLQEDQYLSG